MPEHSTLLAEFMRTPAAKVKGCADTKEPEKIQYVGIFHDVKLSGEPLHRPSIRVSSLRLEDYTTELQLAVCRHGQEGDELHPRDLFFSFDVGKTGNQSDILKPFAGKSKSIKTMIIYREEESVRKRMT